QTAYILTHREEIITQGFLTTYRAFVVLGVGVTLSAGAGVLGLWKTARIRRWGWFAAILVAQVIAGVVSAAFSGTLPLALINSDLALRLQEGEPGASTPYYLVVSVLVVAIPLATLLYGLVGPTQEAVE